MPNVAKFARALYALHRENLLIDDDCRDAIGMFVRQATETPHWHLSAHYRSRRAEAEIQKVRFLSGEHYHRWCSENLRHEHMVPVSEVIDMLTAAPNITEDFIANTLRKYGLRATIHREEDGLLNSKGLARRMPASFRDPNSPLYMDPLARYKETGLFETLVPLAGAVWTFPSAG